MAREKDPIASPTLAELYFQQGNINKAIEALREFLKIHPENDRARDRLKEMEEEMVLKLSEEERRERAEKLKRILETLRKEKGQ